MSCNKPYKNTSQKGNALIIIMVIIALLAALTVIITRMSSKSSGNLNAEQARIAAESIMRTAQSYETAVQKLVNLNRCSENELNFQNPDTTADYTNPDADPDHHCDIFNVAGAGLRYTPPNSNFLEPTESAKTNYGDWYIYGSQCILEVGTGDTTCGDENLDLMFTLLHIKKEICVEINNMNGISNPGGNPPQDHIAALSFKGTFTASDPEIGDTASSSGLIAHTTGCYQGDIGAWAGSYIFYHVILAR